MNGILAADSTVNYTFYITYLLLSGLNKINIILKTNVILIF